MKRVLLRVMLLMVCVLIFGLALADDFDPAKCRLKVKTEREVKSDDQFRIDYALDYDGEIDSDLIRMEINDSVGKGGLQNPEILYLAMSSVGTSVNTVRGETSKRVSVVWQAICRASEAGRYQTPRLSLFYNGKKQDVTCPVSYFMVKGDPAEAQQPKGNVAAADKPVKMRLEASLSSDNVALGDTLTYRVKFLSSTYDVFSASIVRQFMVDDCSWRPVESDPYLKFNDKGEVEATVFECGILPLRKGEFSIPPMEIEVSYKVSVPYRLYDDPPMQANYARKEKVRVSSSEIRFNVR